MVTEKRLSAFSLQQSLTDLKTSAVFYIHLFPQIMQAQLFLLGVQNFLSFMLLSFGLCWPTCSLYLGGRNIVRMKYLEVLHVLSKGKIYSSYFFVFAF